jgi:hypothetical protein
MTSLGQLGVTKVRFKTTFDWFGHEITVSPKFSPLDMIDFLEAASDLDETDPKSVTLVKDLFRSLVDADQFETFWRAAKENAQGVEDLMDVYQKVTAGISKGRSGQPSESSVGTSRTGLRSLDASVSPATATSIQDRIAQRADVQAMIDRAQEFTD